ncbi:hypothetical protein OAV71_04845 [Opitutales bacterium]|nr:hypothetical protein [Opitutales bacterium]
MSWVFYAYWELEFLPLLLFSLVFNRLVAESFTNARFIHDYRIVKKLFILGVAVNLALLGYFKYKNFFLGSLGYSQKFDLSKITIPLGISFFTFQQIAYLSDARKKKSELCSRFEYLLFISFFPQLIAGPILYTKEFIPQIRNPRWLYLKPKTLFSAAVLFIFGLFKKVVIADSFGVLSDTLFASPESIDLMGAWVAMLAFTLQIYYDFSGYCDMAVGSALLFNIRLPRNFHYPYLSSNLSDFWRRWNITVSRWFRDYVFRSLGGAKKSIPASLRNLLITFFFSGIWHGAGLTFIFWGFLHGIGVSVHHTWTRLGMRMPKPLGVLLTFSFFLITAVYFRATNLSDGHRMILGALGLGNADGSWESVGSALSLVTGGYEKSTWIMGVWNSNVILFVGLIIWSIMDHVFRHNAHERLVINNESIRTSDCFLVSAAIFTIVIFNNSVVQSPFIYFDF